MKLKDTFLTNNVEETQVMVNTDSSKDAFHGLVKSNETAAFIINQLTTEKTEDDLVNALLGEYDVDKETATKAVKYVIEKLNSINALE